MFIIIDLVHNIIMNTLITCFEVFFGRILDVGIGSVRTIYLVKQKNLIACILAFIEIIIWFLIARQILTDKELNAFVILSYASGYAFGTYIGGVINKYLVKGTLTAMVITMANRRVILEALRESNYGVTLIPLEDNKVMLLIEFKKRNMKRLKETIKRVDRNAFIIVNETLNVENGYII